MEMVTKKTWEEFRQTGLLWWINRTLHLFGWSIVFEFSDEKGKEDELVGVYPARVKFRGFEELVEEKGFVVLTRYLKNNLDELEKDILDTHEEIKEEKVMRFSDSVIFGPDGEGGAMTYGDARKLLADGKELELIKAFRRKVEAFFIGQTQVLQDNRSAFPLVMQACVGIQRLSRMLGFTDRSQHYDGFIHVLTRLSDKFSNVTDEEYIKNVKELCDEEVSPTPYGDILYMYYLRGTGFGHHGDVPVIPDLTALSYEDTDSIETGECFLKINPDWFWNLVKDYYKKVFDNLEANNSDDKEAIIDYMKKEIG